MYVCIYICVCEKRKCYAMEELVSAPFSPLYHHSSAEQSNVCVNKLWVMGSSSSFRSSFGSEFGGEKASSSYSSSSSSGGCSRRDSNGSFIDDAMQDVSSSSYNETHIATDLRFGSWTSILFGRLSWMPPCVAAGRGRRLGKPRPPDAPTSLCHGDHHLSPYVKCGIRAHAHAHSLWFGLVLRNRCSCSCLCSCSCSYVFMFVCSCFLCVSVCACVCARAP